MPMMTLASTAIDQIMPNDYQVKKTCLSYLPTDTAIFFTADTDRILLKKQRQHFQPILRWLSRSFNINLATSQHMSGRVSHSLETAAKIESIIDQMVR